MEYNNCICTIHPDSELFKWRYTATHELSDWYWSEEGFTSIEAAYKSFVWWATIADFL